MRRARQHVASKAAGSPPSIDAHHGRKDAKGKRALLSSPAAQKFRSFMVNSWAKGGMKDKDVASLSHLAKCAKGEGLEDLALDPELRGRNQARVVRGGLGVTLPKLVRAGRLTYIKVPLWSTWKNKRKFHDFIVRLPHKAIVGLPLPVLSFGILI